MEFAERVLSHSTRFDDWLPIRVFQREGEPWVDWCHFGKARLSQPFFSDSVSMALRHPFNQACRRETPIEALSDWRAASPGIAPTAFVHHASRCGSTLIAQMLAALPSHIVLSEPPALDSLLQARQRDAGITRAAQVQWIRGLVSALAQPRCGESALVIKVDAWNIFALDLLAEAFPGTPWVYLYRDPLEIAASQVRERGSYLVPGMVGQVSHLIPPEEAIAMPSEEFIARVLGRMLEAGAARCADAGGLPLHYTDLPQAMWTSLREMFAIPDTEAAVHAMKAASRFNAKNPSMAFVDESEKRRQGASPALREAVTRFAGHAYRELEAARLARAHCQ